MTSFRIAFFSFIFIATTSAFAMEKPGGYNQTGVNLSPGTYELMLSPALTLSPNGAYLSTELRYQPLEDIGVGMGFGTGEVGYSFGGYGVWYVLPDTSQQPAFAVLGGLYINKIESQTYFLIKAAPTVSKTFGTTWGKITPYAALHFTPGFGLGANKLNEISMKITGGAQFIFSALGSMKLWTEFGLGMVNSAHDVAIGISYPFLAL